MTNDRVRKDFDNGFMVKDELMSNGCCSDSANGNKDLSCGIEIPLGIYVHIPFCKSKCNYCSFVSTTDFSFQQKYVDVLIGEIESCKTLGKTVDSIYIGGGTPSCLFRGGLKKIFDTIIKSFIVSNDAEITVECNPESVCAEFTDECVSCGVTRISMGLQSSCDSVLQSIGRVHNRNMFIEAARMLYGKFNLSSDIILGLPGQKIDDIYNSINIIADYCDHISVYALSVEQNTRLFKDGYTVDDDCLADMYDYACDLLSERNFSRYEISNFAKIGKQCKHNIKYWTYQPYLGFGVAAHGFDGISTRYSHTDDVAKYLLSPMSEKHKLSAIDVYNEYIMLALRTEKGIDLDDFFSKFGFSFIEKNLKALSRLADNGCVIMSNKSIRIAPEYMFVMNGIITEFMLDGSA